jgi:hypothetical protein
MKKLRLALFALMLGIGSLVVLNACGNDDDPGLCTGIYDSENECENAIKGEDHCECVPGDPGSDKWVAVPMR